MKIWIALCVAFTTTCLQAETLRHPLPLERQLKSVSAKYLADQARLRGNARRGALVFFQSPAGCARCHSTSTKKSPLGPNLSDLGRKVSDQFVIESLLHPSKHIEDAYRNHSILTDEGKTLTGIIASETDDELRLRPLDDLTREIVIQQDTIEARKVLPQSIMPDGLMGAMLDQREFLDLAAYVMEVTQGGVNRAKELRPTPEQLIPKDDSVGLDHAGIIPKLRSRDFKDGERIYHGYCYNCHGSDGNTPSLPTARAFGTQKLKFGADPYAMFMTLTKGNGLMAAMSHLTPKERYQVVHYIREAFMKDSNPQYAKPDAKYLAGLPKGTKDGTEVDVQPRDRGPALASQLERKFSSVLTVNLGQLTWSIDLHSMNQAGVWKDGYLDLSETQHYRPRGEGTANPVGAPVGALAGWQWGHDGSLDYSREGLNPRGPIPPNWMHYNGYHLAGKRVMLDYEIDERKILHTPISVDKATIRHQLKIGPGQELLLCAAIGDKEWMSRVGQGLVESGGVFVHVAGDQEGIKADLDKQGRITVSIPEDDETRQIDILCSDVTVLADDEIEPRLKELENRAVSFSFDDFAKHSKPNWPQTLNTVGYLGLEQDAYATDTITIPDSDPWNTWFRTSAIAFFADGRMVVTTYGGDVWIVSGVDQELRSLKWKRFAAGLYEPFGVLVVDDKIIVTCKDRLVRLHDSNGNGEADFYESFSADQDVSINFHAFNFDLQRDSDGNLYYSKSGHGGDSAVPGQVVKVSPDGLQRSIHCTGFRTPNGMGILPDGRVTNSDNQGQWTPASKINLLRPGGFYGWVPTYSKPGAWEPDGGKIDIKKVVAPTDFDQPLVWMPQEFDNSSGGQLFAEDKRFGPLAGHLLHTSFGKGWMSYAMIQDFGDIAQAAIIKLPFDFRTGIMRARTNPSDGQVYATGLHGWNGGARPGILEKGIQRLRYTGRKHRMVRDCLVEPDGLRIGFSFEVDPESASDSSNYVAEHWNYLWQKNYGSEMYSPSTGKVGKDPMGATEVVVGPDRKSIKLVIPKIQRVNQAHVILKITDANGKSFEEEIYWTINRVPGRN